MATMTAPKTNLMTASRQWAERPADERFWTLQDLYRQTREYADESRVKPLQLAACKVVVDNSSPVRDDLALQGPNGGKARFQHYSFGQLCNIASAPAGYLRELPAELAANNLNHGLQRVSGEQLLMFRQNGGLTLRCVTSDQYARIWDWEVAALAMELQERGWRVPPARACGLPDVPVKIATADDIIASGHSTLGIKVGDQISPAGLYASDHDCFIFQVKDGATIEAGGGEVLNRGVFWSNSEVGSARFRATMFLYDFVCGNHIVWGARNVTEVSIVHKGDARRTFVEAMAKVARLSAVAASEDEDKIRAAKRFELGPSKDKIVELVYSKPFGLSKGECEEAYVLAERNAHLHGGNPRSAWGYAAGITRLSQGAYADKRNTMDRAAGKVLEMAF